MERTLDLKASHYIKYWQILLKEWREGNRNGLTIPFIIGSQKYLPISKHQNIAELLRDIASSSEFEVYLTYCTDINDLILGVRDDTKATIAGHHLILENGLPSNFFLTKIVYDLGSDLESVSQELTERYQPYVDLEKFSTNDRLRGAFGDNDIKFIKNCFAKL